MMLVDSRTGSKELVQPLREAGMDVDLTTLDYGDIAFLGRGEGNKPVDVGVELKTLPDAISSLRTGRLAGHQMPGLVDLYDRNIWLLVEGVWSTNKSGLIVQQSWERRHPVWRPAKGKMTGDEFRKRLLTIELQFGCHVIFTNTRRDTINYLVSLYHWWTDKSLDDHRSALVVHNPSTIVPISDERAALMKWPGVGLEWSKAAMKTFGTIEYAVLATALDWANLEATDRRGHTRKFGMQAATKVVNFLRGQ